jgi:hypothetical protein
MFQHTLIQSVQAPSGQLNAGNKVYQGAANLEIDEIILAAAVDFLVNANFLVANVKSVVITSDRDVTLETNNGTTPGNTLALKASVPYIWNTDSYDSLKLTVDVTKFYFTNAGANPANVSVRIIYDPTP